MTIFPAKKSDKYGFVDHNGVPVTDFKYDMISNQTEDIAIGAYTDSQEFNVVNELISPSGQVLLTTKDIIQPFSENIALALHKKKYGFIDKQGHYSIPAIFDYADEEGIFYGNSTGFSEGKTFVLSNQSITLIDHNGAILFQDNSYVDAFRFCNNLALIKDKDRNTFFISSDNTKQNIIPSEYYINKGMKDFSGFRNGYCRVGSNKNNKTTFINTKGELIFPDKLFTEASDFHENLSVVKQEDKYGVINESGDLVIEPMYDFIGYFNNGIAPYQQNRIWGLIDCNGNIIFEANINSETVFERISNFNFNHSDPFHNPEISPVTTAIVKKRNGKFQKSQTVYINRAGEILFNYNFS